MVSNLFGTLDRTQFLFRDALDDVRKLVELKTDPANLRKRPWRYWNLPSPGVAAAAEVRPLRSGSDAHHDGFATAATEVLAAGRRARS